MADQGTPQGVPIEPTSGVLPSAALHDVQNQLSIVLGFAQVCIDADEAGERPERRHLEGIRRAAEEVARIISSTPAGEPSA